MRKGSFFEGSKLDNSTILQIIWYWVHNVDQDLIKLELDINSNTTLVDWFNFGRDVCVEILIKDSKKIGGPGHIVEIDESKFGKRKFNKGRQVDGCWVLGGIDRETRETFFRIVPDRTAETLIPILIEHVHPESTIYSDCWTAYSTINKHFKTL